jgi:hypothetical protein
MTPRFAGPVTAATAALLLAVATPAGAADNSAASKAVWDGHLQKVLSKNLDAVMTDFTDQSTIITPEKTYVGAAEVRGFIGKFIDGLTPEAVKSMVMQAEVPRDDIVFSKFTVAAAKRTFIYTAEIRNGKIITVTTVNYDAE